MKKLIDFRSDTFTKPTQEMLNFMMSAPLGDDVYGEDPTVNKLEEVMAKMCGMESALFASSGTQTNLLAIIAHCERGEEYIVGQHAHTFLWEGGGAGILGSVWPAPIDEESDGTLSLKKIVTKIKPLDDHHARTKLLCLENTASGKVLPLNYLQEVKKLCAEKKLLMHLDGARVFNAAVSLDISVAQIAQYFDSISICLSKGLGSPVGSILCGSQEFIKRARRWRKVLGGGMRQAGILAAAGLYALENNINRLKDDHENAKHLFNELKRILDKNPVQKHNIQLVANSLHTNMFYLKIENKSLHHQLREFLLTKEIMITDEANSEGHIRFVTHLDITQNDVSYVLEQIKSFLNDNF